MQEVAARTEIWKAVFAAVIGLGCGEPVPKFPAVAIDLLEHRYPCAVHRFALFVDDVTGDHALWGQADLGIRDLVIGA
ncbi:MAG TPA: hypothetical protein VLE03_00730 [Nitrospiraceae bacterium]|nr:hypothetical protein [Nitrospiraceae bacterium]